MNDLQNAVETKDVNNTAANEDLRNKLWRVILSMVIISKRLKGIEDSIAENIHIIKSEMQKFEDA
jgi:hypothetical protein